MQSHTLGFGVAYAFKSSMLSFLEKSSLNLRYDSMTRNYYDCRDARFSLGSFGSLPADPLAPGAEPLYKLNANVFQLFLSVWF